MGFVSIVSLYSSFAERLSAIEPRSVDSPLSISFEQVLHFIFDLASSRGTIRLTETTICREFDTYRLQLVFTFIFDKNKSSLRIYSSELHNIVP